MITTFTGAYRALLLAGLTGFLTWGAVAEEPDPGARPRKDNENRPKTAAQRPDGGAPRPGLAGGLGDIGRILTPEQRERFRGAFQEQRAKMRELEETISRLRQELDEAILAEKLDEPGIRERVKQLSEAEGERLLLRARAIATVRPSLTPDQLQQLRESMAQMRRLRRPDNPGPRGPEELRDRRPGRPGEPEREGADLPPPRPANP